MNLTLAAGSQDRWNNGNDSEFKIKQLIEIDGETLIERIQKQFGGYVVTNNPDIMRESNYVYQPRYSRWTVETLFSTREKWRDQMIITLGDVYYTKEAAKTIKSFNGEIQFFGTIHEIFAISFTNFGRISQCLSEHIAKLEKAVTYPSNGKLWQLYRRYHDYDPAVAQVDQNFTLINDKTQDFDFVEELRSFKL